MNQANELWKLEARILAGFKRRCVHYLTRALVDDWDQLFIAQHCGVPTRLLDWTENPFVGLYFATSWSRLRDIEEDAAVWILDPGAWNRHALRLTSYQGDALTIDDTYATSYRPHADGPQRDEPIALYGTHNSARIVAQRGVFTIFGLDTSPMEDMYQNGDLPSQSLIKVVLPAQRLPALRDQLSSIGMTDSVVWPDLDGLAREIKREMRFRL